LFLGHEAQRLKRARARIVEFEQISVDGERAETLLGDSFIGAFGNPFAARIAAAEMNADEGTGAPRRDALVDQFEIAGEAAVGVLAFGNDLGAELRTEEIGEERIVDLDIALA
jgi:hypothetical protein